MADQQRNGTTEETLREEAETPGGTTPRQTEVPPPGDLPADAGASHVREQAKMPLPRREMDPLTDSLPPKQNPKLALIGAAIAVLLILLLVWAFLA